MMSYVQSLLPEKLEIYIFESMVILGMALPFADQ